MHAITVSVESTLMEKEEGEIRIIDRCQSNLHCPEQMKEGQKLQAF